MFSNSRVSSFKWYAKLGGISGVWLTLYPVVSLILSRRRDLDQYSTVDASAVGSMIYVFAAFYIALYDIVGQQNIKYKSVIFYSPLLWLFLYTVLALASSLWSVNPAMSCYRAFECFAFMLLIVACLLNVIHKTDSKGLVIWSCSFAAYYVLAQVALAYKRSSSLSYIITASEFFAPAFFFITFFYPVSVGKKWLIRIATILSCSTVSYIGLAVGSLCFLFHKRYRATTICVLVLVCSFMCTYGVYDVLKATIFADKPEISLSETTGRDQIMKATLAASLDRVYGYGFYAGETYVLYKSMSGAINAHNSFFSALLGTGYVGCLLIFLFFLHMFTFLLTRKLSDIQRASMCGCFCVVFLNSMGNPGIGSRVYGAWLPSVYISSLIVVLSISNQSQKTNRLKNENTLG